MKDNGLDPDLNFYEGHAGAAALVAVVASSPTRLARRNHHQPLREATS